MIKSLMPPRPWLPPMTSKTGLAGSRPNCLRQLAESHGRNSVRTGVPQTVTGHRLSFGDTDENPTNPRSTIHESHRLARPGIELDSCKKVRAPAAFPARIGGALVNPPMARTAWGFNQRNNFLA